MKLRELLYTWQGVEGFEKIVLEKEERGGISREKAIKEYGHREVISWKEDWSYLWISVGPEPKYPEDIHLAIAAAALCLTVFICALVF